MINLMIKLYRTQLMPLAISSPTENYVSVLYVIHMNCIVQDTGHILQCNEYHDFKIL